MVAPVSAPGGGRAKSPLLYKQDLSDCRCKIVELMQGVNYGRIEGLPIRAGEPVLDPPPVVFREHKFGGENGPRPELGSADFVLKQQVVELFTFFNEMQDGVIDVLEIKHGLPFRMIVREVPA